VDDQDDRLSGWIVLLACYLAAMLAFFLLAGCATVVPGHVIVTHHQGQTYCLYGVQLDSHYRCVNEAGPGWPPSAVHHIE
jgi:hypothetical protein